MNNTKRIDKVIIKRLIDESGTPDHLGKYSGTPGDPDKTIDRQAMADWRPGDYRYFIAANGPEETGNPDSVMQDYRRTEAGMNGEWCMVGVVASAVVTLTGSVVQTFTSGGLWGIESDSDASCFAEAEKEELDNLKSELLAAGFAEADIIAAFAEAEHCSEL